MMRKENSIERFPSIDEKRLRDEVSAAVGDRKLSDTDLIQRFCDIVGPGFDISRCCLNRSHGRVFVTETEWVADGVTPTLGAKVSERVIRALLAEDIQELNRQIAEDALPGHLKVLGAPVLAMLEGMQQLVAIIAAPIRLKGEIAAVISLDICTERAHLTGWPRERLDFASELCKMLEAELQRRAR
jgi:hypothetical protein